MPISNNSLRSAAKRLYHRLTPTSARTVLYNLRHGYLPPLPRFPMSEQVFVFDQYKRARMAHYARHLADLACPHEPGLVSIVLPCYNASDYVREALDAILRQTYTHFELITIDDGSTDNTGAILEEYARQDGRVQVIHQENQKVPRTLSRGFRLARGEFFTWVSADNRLKPDFLAHMVASLQAHPDWDMVYGNIDIIDPPGDLIEGSQEYPNYQVPPGSGHVFFPTDLSILNTSHCYIGAAFLYRSRVAWLLGDYSPYRFTVEDYDYWMQVNDFFTLRHADHLLPVYDYRYHGQSLTSQAREHGYLRLIDDALIWDDFRRDVALMPLCWLIDAHNSTPRVRAAITALHACIRRAGHVILESKDAAYAAPAVYARVTSDVQNLPAAPTDLPGGTLKVLFAAGVADLPDQVSPGWDLCVAVGSTAADLPRLSQPYQGWLAADRIETLFTALDIRAKCAYLRHVEDEAFAPQPDDFRCTVIVSVYPNAIEALPQVMAALAAQDIAGNSFETILAIEQSAETRVVRALDKQRQSGRIPFRVVSSPLPGLVHARNLAALAARSPVLCFLDANHLVRPDWLSSALAQFDRDATLALVGGPPDDSNLQGCDLPACDTWSVRREALLKMGGFRTAYAPFGDLAWTAEAYTAGCLLRRMEKKLVAIPEAAAEVIGERVHNAAHMRHIVRSQALLAYLIRRYLANCGQHYARTPSLGRALRALIGLPRPRTVSPGDTMRLWWTHTATHGQLVLRLLRDNHRRLRRPVSRP